MGCEIKTINGETESILARELNDSLNNGDSSITEEQIKYFRSPDFINEFGDYQDAFNNDYQGNYAEMRNRTDENGEPSLLFNETANKYYYLDKNNQQIYFPLINKGLKKYLNYKEIELLTSRLALKYFNISGLNFNNIDFESGEQLPGLESFILNELENKEKEFYDSKDLKLKRKVTTIRNIKPNIKELTLEVENFFKTLSIKVVESENEITQEEIEEDQKDPIFNQMSAERDSKDSVTANIKLRLSLLEDKSKLDPIWNEPTFVKFSEVYSTLLEILTDNTDLNSEDIWDIYKDKIASMKNKKPFLQDLYTNLTSDNFKKENINEFVQAFRLNKNNHMQTDISVKTKFEVSEFGTKTIDKNTGKPKILKDLDVDGNPKLKHSSIGVSEAGSKTELIKDEWFNGFKNKFLTDKNEPNKDSLAKIKSINTAFLDINKKVNQIINNENYKPSDLDDQITRLINGLNAIGLNITADGLSNYLDNYSNNISDEYRISTLKSLIDSLLSATKNIDESFSKKAIYNTNKLFENSLKLLDLAKSEAFFIADGSDANIRQGGKNLYIYSYPSYLSTKFAQWKKSTEVQLEQLKLNKNLNKPTNNLLDELLNSSAYMKGSFTLKYLTGIIDDLGNEMDYFTDSERNYNIARLEESVKRLEKFNIGLFNQLSFNGEFNATTELAYKDYIADDFQKIIKGLYSRTITQADKGSEYQIETGIKLRGADFDGNKSIISNSVKKMQFNYFASEYNRIIEAHNNVNESIRTGKEGSDLVAHYHYKYGDQSIKNLISKNGNAFKSQYYERLSPNTKNLTEQEKLIHDLLYLNGEPILNVLEYDNSELTELIENYIETELLKNINRTLNGLIDADIVQVKDNGDYILANVDESIINSYNEKYNGIKSNNAIVFAAATDYYVNSVHKSIEYSKMFTGDVAYYKNPVDFKKRVPATYTDGLQLRVEPGQESFNIATIQSVMRASPFMEKLSGTLGIGISSSKYEDINSADAQAWITPARWQFLIKGLGKWTSIHESIYKKMMSDVLVEYTEKELKIAAQPLKGVYFGRDSIGKPVFLKYSQAVLSKQLVAGSDLETLYDKMINKSNPIDEVITFDGIKVGSITPSKIHDDNGNMLPFDQFELNSMQLNNKEWKLQQDLPTKTYKSTDVGSQIQKNIFAGLIHNKLDDNYSVNGKFLTGQEVMNELVNTVNNFSKNGLDNIKKQFKISKDYKINDIRGFYNTLIQDLEKRGGSKNVIDALKAEIALPGIPQAGTKLVNVFASMINDRLIKIKTNGGSFIQMSNFGLNKIEGNKIGVMWAPYADETTNEPEKYIDEETGRVKVKPGGILVSSAFIAKYIPNWRSYSSEELFNDIIDKNILENIIGYRIPNQGLSSNDAFRIVGILPESSGDTIVAYTGITTKTGSDYDIDKMYVMFPTYKEVNGKLVYTDSNGTSDDSLANKLIELYKSVLTNPNLLDKIMTPIDIPLFEDEIKDLTSSNDNTTSLGTFDPVNDIKLRYSFLGGKAGVGMEANALVDISRPGNLSFNNTYIGWGNVNNLGETKLDDEYSEKLNSTDLNYYREVMKKIKGKNFNEKEFIDNIKKVSIGDSLTCVLNAFVDIAKDPYITRGNWTTATTNVGNLLLRAGMHPLYTINFMAQPIIKEYVEFQSSLESLSNNDSGNTEYKFKQNLVSRSLNEIHPIYKKIYLESFKKLNIDYKVEILQEKLDSQDITQEEFNIEMKKLEIIKNKELNKISKNFKTEGMSNEELVNTTNEVFNIIYNEHQKVFNYDKVKLNKSLQYYREQIINKSDNSFQLSVLDKFKELQIISKLVKENIDVSKLDTNGMGKNINSLFRIFNIRKHIFNKRDQEGSLKGFETKFNNTTLNAYSTSLQEVVKIVENNPNLFPQAQVKVQNMFNEISTDLYSQDAIKQKLIDDLEASYGSYLISNMFDIKGPELVDIITKLPSRYQEYKLDNKNKYFMFEDLVVKNPKNINEIPIITLNNRKKDYLYERSFTDSWNDLFIDNPKLAEDLIKYAFLVSGFKMNNTQFFTYIPYNYFVSKDINNFINGFTTETQEDFIDLFYRNNFNNNSYIKKLLPSKVNMIAIKDVNRSDAFMIPEITKGNYYVDTVYPAKDQNGDTYEKQAVYKLEGYMHQNEDGEFTSPVYVRVKQASLNLNDKVIPNYNPYKVNDLYEISEEDLKTIKDSLLSNRKGNNIEADTNSITEIVERNQEDTIDSLWEEFGDRILAKHENETKEVLEILEEEVGLDNLREYLEKCF